MRRIKLIVSQGLSLFFLGIFFLFPVSSLAADAPSTLSDKVISGLKNAAEPTYAIKDGPGDTPQGALLAVANNSLKLVLGILGTIAVILVIYAGYLWLTAGGNDENIKKAKLILKQTLFGLIIVTLAYAIIAFVLTLVMQAGGTTP